MKFAVKDGGEMPLEVSATTAFWFKMCILCGYVKGCERLRNALHLKTHNLSEKITI